MPPLKKRNIPGSENSKARPCVEKWNKIWEEMYNRLLKYKQKNGNTLVPQRYKEDPKLGRWVNKQRENKDSLPPERKELLESMVSAIATVRVAQICSQFACKAAVGPSPPFLRKSR